MKKVWLYIHNGILFSHKKNEITPFAAKSMDLEIITLSKISQTEKYKYHDIWYTWNIRNDTNEPIYKMETESQT